MPINSARTKTRAPTHKVSIPVVFWIARAAVLKHWRARVIGTIKPVMAGLAEAAERAQAEGGKVTSMRLDVISDRRRLDLAGFQTQPAQRLDHQLVCPAAQPASGAVPAMLFVSVGHGHLD